RPRPAGRAAPAGRRACAGGGGRWRRARVPGPLRRPHAPMRAPAPVPATCTRTGRPRRAAPPPRAAGPVCAAAPSPAARRPPGGRLPGRIRGQPALTRPFGVGTRFDRVRAMLLENIHPVAEAAFRRAGFEVDVRSRSLSEDELISELPGVSVLGIRSNTTVTP